MATKNLARTVVEGGRTGYSKLDRQRRNRTERRLRFDAEGDLAHGQPRLSGSRGFADRLSPLERWLGSQVGRGWSHVYHEFCARFDERTMKGWHLRDHLLGMVDSSHPQWGGPFLIDRRGILRRRPRPRWARRNRVPPAEEAKAMAWAAGRKVIVRDEVAFWTAGVIDATRETSAQGRRLTADELAVWLALPSALHEKLVYSRGRDPGAAAHGQQLKPLSKTRPSQC